VDKSHLITPFVVGNERRSTVTLEPGIYDRTREGYVELHTAVNVTRVEVLTEGEHAWNVAFWKHARYDWDTAVPVPAEEPKESWFGSAIGALFGSSGSKEKSGLPPAKIYERK
jgi:hypothetical protein